jgi:glutamyl-tRNA(Gln) amidotransferase subunit E
LAFAGVPNETRKAMKDGTTIFERVLPGPDRMYPDTDSPPIPIKDHMIEEIQKNLPEEVSERFDKMQKWEIPADTYTYILKKNLFPLIENIINDFKENPVFVGTLIGHTLKHHEGKLGNKTDFEFSRIYDLFSFAHKRKLNREILKAILPVIYRHPKHDFETALSLIKYQKLSEKEILAKIPRLKSKFEKNKTSKDPGAKSRWIMGQLRPLALGNLNLLELRKSVDGGER